MSLATAPRPPLIAAVTALDALVAELVAAGFDVVGPRLTDGAITIGPLRTAADLPVGVTERQEPGTYRLERRADHARFGFTVGPSGFKRYLYPPRETLFAVDTRDGAFRVQTPPPPRPLALFGARACDLAALAIHDRVLSGGPFADERFTQRRRSAFIVAVPCAESAPTCFCASLGTGPEVDAGFDLRLSELVDDTRHELLLEAGSERGAALLARLPGREATDADIDEARRAVAHARDTQTRRIDLDGLAGALASQPEHPRWNDVARRCLACGNCTMVCPTCFCTAVRDGGDLAGTRSERTREWDSCFTADFSYVHGGPVRPSTRARYRQWLTHKLDTWQTQFGTPGCVGCGRCITWCPTGIDLTEEVAAIRSAPRAPGGPQ